MRALVLGLLVAALSAPGRAAATYSIAATDTRTGAAGSAGASCVPYEVILIYGVAPGRGVIDVQANFDAAAREEAIALLAQGTPPDAIIDRITDPARHPIAPKMQFGVVDTLGRAAGYTGPEALAVAAHRTGAVERYAYAIQGNLLTSARVLDQAEEALMSEGCDLADKLMRALEAGAANGEGDLRCTPEGRPSNSAFIDVTLPDRVMLHISLPDVSPADPVQRLRAEFDAWRAANPCAEETSSAGADSTGSPGPTAPKEEGGGCSCATARAEEAGAHRNGCLALALPLLLGLVRRRATTIPG